MADNRRLSLQPESIPSRSSKSKGKKIWLLVALVLILMGGAAWFWLGNDPAQREAIVSSTKETLAEVKEKAEHILPVHESRRSDSERVPTPEQPPSRNDSISGNAGSGSSGTELVPGSFLPTDMTQPEHEASSDDPENAAPNETVVAVESAQPVETEGEQNAVDAHVLSEDVPEMPPMQAPEGDLKETTSIGPEAPVTRGILATNPDQSLPADLARRDDAVVRVAFIDDLAKWMVGGYSPANSRGGRGMIAIGIQSANARYGVGMQGLSWIGEDLPAGRAEALGYVYTPSMLDALYRMYIDRFMQAMAEASEAPRKDGKTLEPAQMAEMYRLYARRFRSLSGTMQGIAALGDLSQRVQRIHSASQAMMEANGRYMEEVFAFDQARAGDDAKATEKARAAMEAASDTYLQATSERDRLREELIGAIRNNPEARSFGDDNLLYTAFWVERRLRQSPQALDATLQAATLFLDLAQRFEQAAGVRP